MVRRLIQFLILLPLAALLIVFSVANRHSVTLSLDPFGAAAPGWSVSMPLFVLFFASLLIGVLLGGAAAWVGQGKWRRRARLEHEEATRWRHRANELTRTETPQRATVPAARHQP